MMTEWQEREPEFYQWLEDWLEMRINTPERKQNAEYLYSEWAAMQKRKRAIQELKDAIVQEFPFKQLLRWLYGKQGEQ